MSVDGVMSVDGGALVAADLADNGAALGTGAGADVGSVSAATLSEEEYLCVVAVLAEGMSGGSSRSQHDG